jgi:hypothetical protein
MTSKFEQLIEYVINDEEAKAKELFHDIVVEKSREIYENLMSEEQEEELDEAAEEGLDEAADEEIDESEEELMNDVEAEEQGMQEEEESDSEFDDAAEEDGEELTHDMEKDHDDGADIEDRVVDLEDKLDELMAEFESLMGGEGGDSVSDIDGGDALEMDDTDTAEFSDEEMGMMEAINLAKAPAPVTSEPAGTNTKSTNANNSGAKGAMAHPVKMTGDTAEGRPAPKAGELIGKVQNSVGGDKKLSPATKPHLAQATGVNTKTPFPKA